MARRGRRGIKIMGVSIVTAGVLVAVGVMFKDQIMGLFNKAKAKVGA